MGGGYIEDAIRKPLFDTDVALVSSSNFTSPPQQQADDQPYLPYIAASSSKEETQNEMRQHLNHTPVAQHREIKHLSSSTRRKQQARTLQTSLEEPTAKTHQQLKKSTLSPRLSLKQ